MCNFRVLLSFLAHPQAQGTGRERRGTRNGNGCPAPTGAPPLRGYLSSRNSYPVRALLLRSLRTAAAFLVVVDHCDGVGVGGGGG